MSSTNRSNARKDHIADYYCTPVKDVELFLKEFNKRIPLDWNKIKIIDPCAGGNPEVRDENGKLREVRHEMSYDTAIHNVFGNCNVNNIDIREDSLAETKGNYLEMDSVKKFAPDVIITNPPFNCFSSDTEIKTKRGWVKYTELLQEDVVLSCNIYSQQLEWSKINCIIEKDIDEEVINFKHRFLDMIVTKEHRMFSYTTHNNMPQINNKTNDVYLAQDMNQTSYIPKSGYQWIGNLQNTFVLNGCYVSDGQKDVWHEKKIINMKDWADFLGLWMADGYCRHTLNSQGNQRYTCGIKQSEITSDQVRNVLEKLPFDYKEYYEKNEDKINFEIHSKQLWIYMIQFGKSRDKFIPSYIKDNDVSIIRTFLNSYMFGDSTKTNGGYILKTVSKKLAEDLQEIILKLGFLIHLSTDTITYNNEPYIIYRISYTTNKATQNRLFYCSNYKYKNYIHYKGKVFCLNIDKNHFFLLRRNGYEFFSGNCAVPIIEKAIDDVSDNGYVIMLLRLNFFGSKEREVFFKKYMPEWCFTHHIRIGFTDKKDDNGYVVLDNDGNPKRGSTDSIEYCHMVWSKANLKPEYTKMVYI